MFLLRSVYRVSDLSPSQWVRTKITDYSFFGHGFSFECNQIDIVNTCSQSDVLIALLMMLDRRSYCSLIDGLDDGSRGVSINGLRIWKHSVEGG